MSANKSPVCFIGKKDVYLHYSCDQCSAKCRILIEDLKTAFSVKKIFCCHSCKSQMPLKELREIYMLLIAERTVKLLEAQSASLGDDAL